MKSRSFVSFLLLLTIILYQSDPSKAQRCTYTCTQTVIARNRRSYQEAYEIIQNRSWEDEDDFGDELGDLILRHRRNKRSPQYSSYYPSSYPASTYATTQDCTYYGTCEDFNYGLLAAAGLYMTANMVMPMFMGTAPSPPLNFAGPLPGTLGGGFLPTALANPTVIAATTLFAGLGLIGAGRLIAVFDETQTNDGDYRFVGGIFEEGDGLPSRLRGKREVKKQIISFAKLLVWINETIEKGQHEISSLLIRKLLGKFQKEKLYGVFADVTLMEEEVDCNLTPYTCSRFEPFLTLPAYPSQNHIRRSDDDIYRKQGETNFSFRRPICRSSCFG